MDSCFKCGKSPEKNKPTTDLTITSVCVEDNFGEEKEADLGLCANCHAVLLYAAGAGACDRCGEIRFDVRKVVAEPAVTSGNPDNWAAEESENLCHSCAPDED